MASLKNIFVVVSVFTSFGLVHPNREIKHHVKSTLICSRSSDNITNDNTLEGTDPKANSALSKKGIKDLAYVSHLKKRDVGRILSAPPPSKTEVFDELLGVTPFNTTMNFIVPGAKVHLAHNTEEGSLDHLAMQAFFGLFWAIAWLTTIAVPWIVTFKNFQPFGLRSFHSDPDPNNSFHLDWKLDERVSDAIGLNWDSCVQKTICQAHENPEKYGVLGLTLQLLFPVADNARTPIRNTYRYNSKAYHPKSESSYVSHNTEAHEAIGQEQEWCGHRHRCFFDVLDVLLYLKNYCFATLSSSIVGG